MINNLWLNSAVVWDNNSIQCEASTSSDGAQDSLFQMLQGRCLVDNSNVPESKLRPHVGNTRSAKSFLASRKIIPAAATAVEPCISEIGKYLLVIPCRAVISTGEWYLTAQTRSHVVAKKNPFKLLHGCVSPSSLDLN